MIKFNKNTPTLDAMERFTFSPKKSDFRDVDLELGAAEREPGADWESLFMLFFFLISFLFINIHIQECAHFSAAGHDKGKRFQWWILVCVCKFHACEVGLIARQTEVLLFLHKQLQSRERQCERPSLARPRGMTGGTSSPVSGLSSEG